MKLLNFNSFSFLKSFSCIKEIDINFGFEIACIGYSNVGKSTLINVLSNKKKLSRVSKLPGSTQLINFFNIFDNFRIIDFPGYGYSKFSKQSQLKWVEEIKKFISYRKYLIGVIILVDINFFFKKNDLEIMNVLNKKKIKIIILLNKCDKINNFLKNEKYILAKKKILSLKIKADIQIFSSFKKIGILQLKKKINSLYIKKI
ncbi:MAG: ribosome biogenesis GTP-binding protein YsxC [Buchnera aphidicola (Periphyllus acericola)]|uniref:ribosome biogenesis GTP-binding protein YihA/YsxC n=1 Tax=Buchnera aphidicola TaxID=9 RepID=UPI0030CCB9CE|nr:ribosome biogenesis GTP-binding protein YsxC [Buchnera aphidicola (Periphyllus acericola)]